MESHRNQGHAPRQGRSTNVRRLAPPYPSTVNHHQIYQSRTIFSKIAQHGHQEDSRSLRLRLPWQPHG
ncbi:hypothetical protein HYQ46_009540 [Verticillium longisporum]|nr:hypothetical protein HYQ46_009540 [Verticillium longisporum]